MLLSQLIRRQRPRQDQRSGKEGTQVIVQVEKEERGNKGAALTTFISLAGRYMVLMPNNPRAGGISRRIEGDERSELRDALSSINIPDSMGVIVRTAVLAAAPKNCNGIWIIFCTFGLRSNKHLKERKAPITHFAGKRLTLLSALFATICATISTKFLSMRKNHLAKRCDFVEQVMPHFKSKIKLYKDQVPLFNRYQIESQIESAFQREVQLPSGGSIVIDPTEALVSIDINSAAPPKAAISKKQLCKPI